jgi:hypothetical protein
VKGFIRSRDTEKDGLGFQVFNAPNNEIIANEPTTSFLTDTLCGRRRPANSRGLRPRCLIERRAKVWAFVSGTTAKIHSQFLIDRQSKPADYHHAALVTRSDVSESAGLSGLHGAGGQAGDNVALS